MALTNKRIIDLPERASLNNDDYTVVDGENGGTGKYKLSQLQEDIGDVEQTVTDHGTRLTTAEQNIETNANDIVDLKEDLSQVQNGLKPYRINIADPTEQPVNLYVSSAKFLVAEFVYTLPVEVKPNTKYTVMQKATASVDFHVYASENYPEVNGAARIIGTQNPIIFTTGSNEHYISVTYYNSRRDTDVIEPNTIMIAEGEVTSFVEYGDIDTVLPGSIDTDKLSEDLREKAKIFGKGEQITYNNTVISDGFYGSVQIEAAETADIYITNENMLLKELYETVSQKVTNGITFKVNADGTITANGTATANADFYVRGSKAKTIPDPGIPLFFSCLTEPSNDYFAYSSAVGYGDNGYGVVIRSRITTMFIRIRQGATVNNVLFKPMLTYGPVRKNYIPSVGTIYTNTQNVEVNIFDDVIIAGSSMITVTGHRSKLSEMEDEKNRIIRDRNIRRIKKDHVISVCHRGYLTEAPENTVYAFRAAVEDDIEYLESDIQFTSDGVPVMFHDGTIERIVTGHTGKISDYTYEQVENFDVYTYFRNEHPDKWKDEYVNARIMSLEDYLKFAKGVGKPSALEIKGANVSDSNINTVIALIDKYEYGDFVAWMGSRASYNNILRMLSEYPELTFLLTLDGASTESDYNILKYFDTGINVLGIASDNYNEEAQKCKEKNLILYAYLINTQTEALNLSEYVTMTASNGINVHKELKKYYLGN